MRHASVAGLALAVVLAACGPSGTPLAAASRGPRPLDFTDEGSTVQSPYDGREPKVAFRASGDRTLVTVYQGRQSSGGYAIRVEHVTAVGTGLRLQARFTVPPPGGVASAVLTSPAHTIGIAFRPDEVILLDQDDRERARATIP